MSPPFAWCPSCQAVTVVAESGYVAREDWDGLAACKGHTATFFAVGRTHAESTRLYAAARAICETCPVRPECLADWLDMPAQMQHHGYRAGYSPRALTAARSAARRRAVAA